MSKYPQFDKLNSYIETLDPAMKITNEAEAKEYFEALVQYTMKFGEIDREKAIVICKSNLGYYAGYGSEEQRERVERLFDCAHPIFGKVSTIRRDEQSGAICNSAPTTEEAYQAGLNYCKTDGNKTN